METQAKIGIYCLANDTVLDWMIAFLESLRTYEPYRKLIVIPFDDRIDKLRQISKKYDFDFFNNDILNVNLCTTTRT